MVKLKITTVGKHSRYCTNFELPVPYGITYNVLPEDKLQNRWGRLEA